MTWTPQSDTPPSMDTPLRQVIEWLENHRFNYAAMMRGDG